MVFSPIGGGDGKVVDPVGNHKLCIIFSIPDKIGGSLVFKKQATNRIPGRILYQPNQPILLRATKTKGKGVLVSVAIGRKDHIQGIRRRK